MEIEDLLKSAINQASSDKESENRSVQTPQVVPVPAMIPMTAPETKRDDNKGDKHSFKDRDVFNLWKEKTTLKTPVRVKHQATQTEKSPQSTRQEAEEEKKDEVTMTKKNSENSVTDNDLKEMIEQVFKKFITESN